MGMVEVQMQIGYLICFMCTLQPLTGGDFRHHYMPEFCDLSHEVWCRILFSWHHIRVQRVLDSWEFLVFHSGIFNLGNGICLPEFFVEFGCLEKPCACSGMVSVISPDGSHLLIRASFPGAHELSAQGENVQPGQTSSPKKELESGVSSQFDNSSDCHLMTP